MRRAIPRSGRADYKLAAHLPDGRGVYTFCMCPGGQVVAAASEEGGVVVNGMSRFARDGENANSALLVEVRPDDLPGDDVLAGVAFQRHMERAAYEAARAAGGAPYARARSDGGRLSVRARRRGQPDGETVVSARRGLVRSAGVPAAVHRGRAGPRRCLH